jgi:hypothetical protein
MNRPLSSDELKVLEADFPVTEAAPLSKQQKLWRLADLVERVPHPIVIFHRLEYLSEVEKYESHNQHPYSAFALAAQDATFQKDGLKGQTIAEAQRYFELSNQELHAFSCDCGGAIDNRDMARRLRRLAAGGSQPTLGRRIQGFFGA